jgi:hypothetical protein
MLRELMKAGSENGIRSMVAITTATNHAMQHLLKHNVDNVKIVRDGSEVWRGLRLYLLPPRRAGLALFSLCNDCVPHCHPIAFRSIGCFSPGNH